jgi:hypothetical protein
LIGAGAGLGLFEFEFELGLLLEELLALLLDHALLLVQASHLNLGVLQLPLLGLERLVHEQRVLVFLLGARRLLLSVCVELRER